MGQKEKTTFDSELTSPSSFYSKAFRPGSAVTLTGLVADRLFDSMSSVVGDRAVAQAAHSLPKCDGKVVAIDACAATKLSQQQEQCEQSAQSESG